MSTRNSFRLVLARALSGLGIAWHIFGITLILVVATELSFAGLQKLREKPTLRVRLLDARLAAQDNPPGLREEHIAQEDSRLKFEEFAYWRRDPMASATLNIDGRGFRRTYNPVPDASDVIKIFVMGGSTIWGWNSRDDFTIPSQLSKLASRHGFKVHVTNYGQTGYVTRQEAIALMNAIGSGERPNLVVLLNGLNDVESSIFNSRAGTTFWFWSREWWFRRMFEGTTNADGLTTLWRNTATYQFLTPADTSEPEVEDYRVRTLARRIAGQYASSVASVDGLASAFGFQPFFYLQPILFTKKKLTTVERNLIPVASNHFLRAGNRALFLEAYKQIGLTMKSNPRFKDIEGLFMDTDELVYSDGQHYSEKANQVIAEAIFEDLREPLQHLSETSATATVLK